MTRNERLFVAKKLVRQAAELAGDIMGWGLAQRSALGCHFTALIDALDSRCPTAPAADDQGDYCNLGASQPDASKVE